MKKITLFFFFLNSFYAGAQTSVYHPFPVSGGVWIMHSGCNAFPCNCTFNYRYSMVGDTLINGYSYHKINTEANGSCYPCGCFALPFNGQFIREDSLKRIWVFDTSLMSDTLLYDFNLTVGDTIHTLLSEYYPGGTYIVQSIDSILIGNNYRKRFNYSNNIWGSPDSCTNFLIEGVGTGGGLFSPLCARFCFESEFTLLCYKENENVSFFNSCAWLPTDTNIVCNFLLSNQNQEPEKQFSLFPNPATSEFTISDLRFTISEIEINNTLGEVVFSSYHSSFITHHSIDVRQLPPGIYFVLVTYYKGNKIARKFVKM